MAINPTGPISTPILTYATPAQRKAVGQESEEDKARPLPPVEEGQQSEASANRKRDPNRIEEELPDRPPQERESPAKQASADPESESLGADPSAATQSAGDAPFSLQRNPSLAIEDLLDLAAKGLKYKDSDGVK